MVLFGFSVLAQDNKGWKFSLGFDPMITWLSAKDDLKSDGSRLGFDFSLYAENYFHNRYAFYIGLSYMNMGGKLKNNGNAPLSFNYFDLEQSISTSLNAQYLSIPFGIKLHTAEFRLFSYYFNAGLYTGIRVGGSVRNPTSNEKCSISNDVNLITAGCQLGSGLMYAIADGTYLQTGLKFNYGFVDMLKTSKLNGQPLGVGLHIGILF
jgi:hypothetical protein